MKKRFMYPDILLAFIKAGFDCKDNMNGYSFTVYADRPSNIAFMLRRDDILKIARIIEPNPDVGCDLWLENRVMKRGTFDVFSIERANKAFMESLKNDY